MPGSLLSVNVGRPREIEWLDRRDPAHPFFGFLYYDAVAANKPIPDFPAPPVPPGASKQARLYASYLTNLRYVDALIGRVLDDLERRRLLEQTIVIITSDHGMEFDEFGQGFTGHGTSFSDYQVHTPFVLRWPGRAPSRGGAHDRIGPVRAVRLPAALIAPDRCA